jgi:hypothetical protein
LSGTQDGSSLAGFASALIRQTGVPPTEVASSALVTLLVMTLFVKSRRDLSDVLSAFDHADMEFSLPEKTYNLVQRAMLIGRDRFLVRWNSREFSELDEVGGPQTASQFEMAAFVEQAFVARTDRYEGPPLRSRSHAMVIRAHQIG